MVNDLDQKSCVIEKKFKNIDKEALANTSWNEVLVTYCNDPNISLGLLLKMVNSILDKLVPLTRITKKMQKTYGKPWLTKDIMTSINNKNRIYKKLCKAKDPYRRDMLHN